MRVFLDFRPLATTPAIDNIASRAILNRNMTMKIDNRAAVQAMKADAHEAEFPVSFGGLAAAFGFVETAVETIGASETLTHRISVVVDELVANMMRYDHTLDEHAQFMLCLVSDGGGIRLTVSDPGRPFDPLAFRHQSAPDIGGHGISLVKNLARHASYERRGGRNSLSMVFEADH